MLLNLIFSRIAVEERRRWRNNREVNKSIDPRKRTKKWSSKKHD